MPWKQFLKWMGWLLPAGLVLLIFTLPRQQDLDRYVTADEPMYIRESGGFFAALHEAVFEQTYRVIQPGVPTLWMGALAFQRLYPAYASSGNLETSDFQLWTKLRNVHLTLMQLLVLARLHSLRLLAVAVVLAFLYARRLFGWIPALIGFCLLAFNPFFLAHSQLLATDAPLATFLLVSLLALLSYDRTHRPGHLAVAGVFGGLATLSKITGILILPFGLLIWLLVIRRPHRNEVRGWRRWLAAGLFIVSFCIVALLLWPVLWTQAPQILAKLLNFSIISAEGQVNSNSFFLGKMIPDGNLGGLRYAIFYPLTYVWRSTPLELLGVILMLVGWRAAREAGDRAVKRSLWILLAFALLFGIFLTFSSKKIDRYLLPVYPLGCLAAGVGWTWLSRWLGSIKPARIWAVLGNLLLIAAIAGQALTWWGTKPYPIAYANPLLGGSPAAARAFLTGWGEGLDQAAEFLNNQPDPKSLQVYSWYAAALNLQFVGRATDLPISGTIDDALFERILACDYAVIYYHQWQRQTSLRLLEYLADKPYVFSASIDSLEVVRVYDLNALRKDQANLLDAASLP